MIDTARQLMIPAIDQDFFVLNEDRVVLERFEKMSGKHPVNVLITGNQGCGKSSLVRQFAGIFNRPMATFQVGLLSEAGEFFGQQRLKGGETFYKEFLFPKAIQTPGCVIHLEEINRSESPHALNELFSILSESRCIWIDELGFVQVAPQVIFFATMNEGDGFTGAETLDAALRDRFYRIHLEYLPLEVEKEVLIRKTGIDAIQAKQILNIIGKIRNNEQTELNISIRHSLMIAELVSLGSSLKEALIYGLQISRDALESLLLAVHVETCEHESKSGACAYVPYLPDRSAISQDLKADKRA